METLIRKDPLTIKREKLALLRQKRILRARETFWEFCLWYDYDFFTARPFLEQVAWAFQYLYEQYKIGNAVKIVISMPPRAGKSYITSLFCAWYLGKFPEMSIMRNACTSPLYDKFSYDARNIIKSEKYTQIFENVKLQYDKQNLDGWNLETAKQVSYFGAGVGGTIIGFGAGLAISDDLYRSLEDALSPGYQERALRWKESAHDSRKELNCPEIYIGTRWTKRDIIGLAIDGGVNINLVIPALVEDRSFCENVKSTSEYLEIKSKIDELIWEAEYMQNPVESKNLLFPIDALKFYDNDEFDPVRDMRDVDYIMTFVDPANKGGDSYSSPTGFIVGSDVYIGNVIFSNKGTDHTIGQTVEVNSRYKTNELIIEGNFGWAQVGAEIREYMNSANPECSTMIFKEATNKETRILAQSAFIRNNFHFNSEYKLLPEYKKFIDELTRYNKSGENDHDDAPDSCAGLAFWLQRNIGHQFK